MRYRKKPVVIEARELTVADLDAVAAWCGSPFRIYDDVVAAPHILISTLEGVMRAEVGDWIIQGVKGEFYPCKPDIFAATYEPVGENAPSIRRQKA